MIIGGTFAESRARDQAWETKRAQWHRWFAWYPCHVLEGQWVWLEEVERRREIVGYDPAALYPDATQSERAQYAYQYRLPKKEV